MTTTGNDDFVDNIKQWVALDNEIKTVNERLNDLRDRRSNLANTLTTYADTHNLNASTIQLNDGKLKFAKTKVTQPISLKHLEKCLGEIIADKTQVQQIVEYIKDNRETKVVPEIKRYSNK